MRCSLSGESCTTPVVSIKTGHVYEQRIIEKALQNNGGKCPYTGVKLSISDLIPVKCEDVVEEGSTPQRTDVRSILQHVQNEWDSRAIEVFELRKALQRTRQELATALYRVDAAHRVIAKMREERNHSEALPGGNSLSSNTVHDVIHKEQGVPEERIKKKQRVAENGSFPLTGVSLQPSEEKSQRDTNESERGTKESQRELEANQIISKEHSSHSEHVEGKWPNDLLNKVQKLGLELMTARKGRVVKESWSTAGDVSTYSVAQQCLASSEPSFVSCIQLGNDNNAFVGLSTGGIKTINCKSMVVKSALEKCDTGAGINCLWWDKGLGTRIASGGNDGVVRLWDWEQWKQLTHFEEGSEIVGLQQHMEGSISLVGRSKGWTWRDLNSGKAVAKSEKLESQYLCSAIHPDGMMFAMASTDGPVEVWDVGNMQCVNRLGENGEPTTSIAMSEKGYYMASCRNDVVEMWDLRKPGVVGSIKFENTDSARAVALDGLGEFGCAVSSECAVLFVGKKKAKVLSRVKIPETIGNLNQERNSLYSSRLGVAWGHDARWVLVGTGGPSSSIIKLQS